MEEKLMKLEKLKEEKMGKWWGLDGDEWPEWWPAWWPLEMGTWQVMG